MTAEDPRGTLTELGALAGAAAAARPAGVWTSCGEMWHTRRKRSREEGIDRHPRLARAGRRYPAPPCAPLLGGQSGMLRLSPGGRQFPRLLAGTRTAAVARVPEQATKGTASRPNSSSRQFTSRPPLLPPWKNSSRVVYPPDDRPLPRHVSAGWRQRQLGWRQQREGVVRGTCRAQAAPRGGPKL